MSRLFAVMIDRSASAAVELARVMPLLLILLFSSFEAGNFFMSEHVVQKGVRDAARYAARLPISNYPGCGSVNATSADAIKKLARTGSTTGTVARIGSWSNDAMTSVTVACASGPSYSTGGIYTEFPAGYEGPVVTVTAVVPYSSVLAAFGFDFGTLNLNAHSQAAVIGA